MAHERNGSSPMTISRGHCQKRPPRRRSVSTIPCASTMPAASASSSTSRTSKSQQIVQNGLAHPREPRASRRRGRRSADGRRRRHHGADPAQLLRRARWASWASRLPEPGEYAVGFIFMPQDAELRAEDGARRRQGHRGRGPDRARLARRAVGQLVAVARPPRSRPPSPATARSSSAAATASPTRKRSSASSTSSAR